jgi:acyl dehydratase
MKGRIAQGMLVRAMATGQVNQLGLFEGTTLAPLGMDRIRWTVVTMDVVVRNQRGETVCQAGWTTLMARRRGAA